MNLRERILETCFSAHEGEFAGGEAANNKLNLELIRGDHKLTGFIIQALSKNALEHNPEFVVGVPDGATWLADKIALRCGLYSVHLKKNEQDGTKLEFAHDSVDREMTCEPLSRGVLVEDVFNRFTSTRRALAIPVIRDRVVAAEGIWDRGCEPRETPDLPIRALVEYPIPAMLPDSSALWAFAQPRNLRGSSQLA